MIHLRDVVKSYRRGADAVVACAVDRLDVARGEQVALVGRSGTGKTTLLHILAGILRPDRGEVEVVGARIDRMGESACDRHRGRHVGMVYQTFNLLQPFTALENVLLGALFGKGAGNDARLRAEALLQQVGLADRMHHRPRELSVGQVQRVAICRALVNDPELILMDEPLGNQDKATGGQVLDLLLQIAEHGDKTVVMVTHDPESAKRMQRTVDLATLRGGAVVEAAR
jgi:ABC-type lipoprotein export system ATPase subunit